MLARIAHEHFNYRRSTVCPIPASTQRRFNVVSTLLTSKQRCINVKTTSFADRDHVKANIKPDLLSPILYSTVLNHFLFSVILWLLVWQKQETMFY